MDNDPPGKLPDELVRYTIMSAWDREEADARRRQRALAELASAGRGRRSV